MKKLDSSTRANIRTGDVIADCVLDASAFYEGSRSEIFAATRENNPALISAHMLTAALLFHARVVRKAADDIGALLAQTQENSNRG